MSLGAAIERAQSRSAVLSGLSKAFSKSGKDDLSKNSGSNSTKAPQKTPTTMKDTCPNITESVDRSSYFDVIDILAGGDRHGKLKKSISESISSKTIVLNNVQAQLDATKAANRNKRFCMS